MLLVRARSQRVQPVLTHLPDGSCLSELDRLSVRIVEADLTMRGADGTAVGDRYRLITTLLDHHRYPADAVIRLHHERWEIESAYLALRHTMLDGHVLRSHVRAGGDVNPNWISGCHGQVPVQWPSFTSTPIWPYCPVILLSE